jgi:hypothetical protein
LECDGAIECDGVLEFGLIINDDGVDFKNKKLLIGDPGKCSTKLKSVKL